MQTQINPVISTATIKVKTLIRTATYVLILSLGIYGGMGVARDDAKKAEQIRTQAINAYLVEHGQAPIPGTTQVPSADPKAPTP